MRHYSLTPPSSRVSLHTSHFHDRAHVHATSRRSGNHSTSDMAGTTYEMRFRL